MLPITSVISIIQKPAVNINLLYLFIIVLYCTVLRYCTERKRVSLYYTVLQASYCSQTKNIFKLSSIVRGFTQTEFLVWISEPFDNDIIHIENSILSSCISLSSHISLSSSWWKQFLEVQQLVTTLSLSSSQLLQENNGGHIFSLSIQFDLSIYMKIIFQTLKATFFIIFTQ